MTRLDQFCKVGVNHRNNGTTILLNKLSFINQIVNSKNTVPSTREQQRNNRNTCSISSIFNGTIWNAPQASNYRASSEIKKSLVPVCSGTNGTNIKRYKSINYSFYRGVFFEMFRNFTPTLQKNKE